MHDHSFDFSFRWCSEEFEAPNQAQQEEIGSDCGEVSGLIVCHPLQISNTNLKTGTRTQIMIIAVKNVSAVIHRFSFCFKHSFLV